MRLGSFKLDNRKFVSRILKSEASIFIFFYKNFNKYHDESKYLLIQKERIVSGFDQFPTLTNNISFEIISKIESSKHILDISHIYNPKRKDWDYQQFEQAKMDYKATLDYMCIDINTIDLSENENKIYDLIKIQDLDLKNYYKVFDQNDFFYNFYTSFLPHKIYHDDWTFDEFYGLFKKHKKFTRQCSDFGSENVYTFVMANSKYIFSKPKLFGINYNPRDVFSQNVNEFLKDIFDYFYDGKKYLCINFDLMKNDKFGSRFYHENRSINPGDKKYPFPIELISDTFIISSQIVDFEDISIGNK